jgi:ABC-type Zn uptake system ZnuABC Zn-binding protein ZnuA
MKRLILALSVVGFLSLAACNSKVEEKKDGGDTTKITVVDTIKPVVPVVTPTVTPIVKK